MKKFVCVVALCMIVTFSLAQVRADDTSPEVMTPEVDVTFTVKLSKLLVKKDQNLASSESVVYFMMGEDNSSFGISRVPFGHEDDFKFETGKDTKFTGYWVNGPIRTFRVNSQQKFFKVQIWKYNAITSDDLIGEFSITAKDLEGGLQSKRFIFQNDEIKFEYELTDLFRNIYVEKVRVLEVTGDKVGFVDQSNSGSGETVIKDETADGKVEVHVEYLPQFLAIPSGWLGYSFFGPQIAFSDLDIKTQNLKVRSTNQMTFIDPWAVLDPKWDSDSDKSSVNVTLIAYNKGDAYAHLIDALGMSILTSGVTADLPEAVSKLAAEHIGLRADIQLFKMLVKVNRTRLDDAVKEFLLELNTLEAIYVESLRFWEAQSRFSKPEVKTRIKEMIEARLGQVRSLIPSVQSKSASDPDGEKSKAALIKYFEDNKLP